MTHHKRSAPRRFARWVLRYPYAFLKFARICSIQALRILGGPCEVCNFRWLVRIQFNEQGIRCPKCFAGTVHMSIVHTLREQTPDLSTTNAYELSTRGPLFSFLERNCASVVGSEYWPDVAPGDWRDGYQCQNVESLTYPDDSFDLCTSTEVFEHVVDDMAGFAEIRRVLKPGGKFAFTVPLALNQLTLERARIVDGEIEHLTEPEYHDDSIRGNSKVLAFRTYGPDIVDSLLEAGFEQAFIDQSCTTRFHGYGRAVVVALT